jgi:hypothetical protein
MKNGCGMQDTGCKMRDAGYGMHTPCAGFSKHETGIPPGTRYRVSGVGYRAPGTRDRIDAEGRGPNTEPVVPVPGT